MRIIISPAKRMNVDTDSIDYINLPLFLSRTEELKRSLQKMRPKDLQALWKCNDVIATLNLERLHNMNLRRNLTPAILAFDGLQYLHMAPRVFEFRQFDYIQENLRILSGFYGLLSPLDGVVPYRLEMQAKLKLKGHKDLYGYWSERLAGQLAKETRLLLNLASKEYSRAVLPYLPPEVQVVTCVFGEVQKGRIVQKGTLCKMARGEMVRYLAENEIADIEDIESFCQLGYEYSRTHSGPNQLVFVRESHDIAGRCF